jgi:hypothetical protein
VKKVSFLSPDLTGRKQQKDKQGSDSLTVRAANACANLAVLCGSVAGLLVVKRCKFYEQGLVKCVLGVL